MSVFVWQFGKQWNFDNQSDYADFAFIVIGIRLKYRNLSCWLGDLLIFDCVTSLIGILLMYLTQQCADWWSVRVLTSSHRLSGIWQQALCLEHRYLFTFSWRQTMALAWVMDKCLYEKKSLVNVMLGLTKACLISTCTNTQTLFWQFMPLEYSCQKIIAFIYNNNRRKQNKVVKKFISLLSRK